MEQGFQLRDVYHPGAVEKLAEQVGAAWPAFDRAGFNGAVIPKLAGLSFGGRANLIRDTLWEYLPREFPRAVRILLDSLGPEIPHCELDGFEGFTVMCLNDFVARYGLEHYELSLQALHEMTKRFTAEGAIRAFLQHFPAETLAVLEGWAEDPNCHVRRLVSEGTRPRLPLAPRLQQFVADPLPVLRLLEKLKDDPERMVQRSVANNLNDIAKDHPELVVQTLQRWQASSSPATGWIAEHAARTLVKQGLPGALELLGFPSQAQVSLPELRVRTPNVQLGSSLEFVFELRSEGEEAQNLVIDYIIHHVKANGRSSPKVFKLTRRTLAPGQTISIARRHAMRAIHTRAYYPGTHRLEIQVNGQVLGGAEFELSL